MQNQNVKYATKKHYKNYKDQKYRNEIWKILFLTPLTIKCQVAQL